MKKVHYLPLALLLGAGVAFAAPRRVITGTVVSQKDGRPLELATARLVLRADTTKFLAGAVTDSLDAGVNDWSKLKNVVRDELSDFFWKKMKRTPVILPIILGVN